jgi:hypothetical protein
VSKNLSPLAVELESPRHSDLPLSPAIWSKLPCAKRNGMTSARRSPQCCRRHGAYQNSGLPPSHTLYVRYMIYILCGGRWSNVRKRSARPHHPAR